RHRRAGGERGVRERGAAPEAVPRRGDGPRRAPDQAYEPHHHHRRPQGVAVGQKTHPRGFRLGIVSPWKSRWYAEKNFPQLLAEDETLRKYLHQRLGHASVSEVEIERKPQKVIVTVHTARPGVVIGKGGSEVDKLRDELGRLTSSEVAINVEEVKRPEIEAQLIADSIAHQL